MNFKTCEPSALRTFLQGDIKFLKGVGEKRALFLKKLGCNNYLDLLFHLPNDYIRRYLIDNLDELQPVDGKLIATFKIQIAEIETRQLKFRDTIFLKARGWAEKAAVDIIYFSTYSSIRSLFRVGQTLIISGELVKVGPGQFEMNHPHYVVPPNGLDQIPKLEPIYPLTKGINNKLVLNSIRQILSKLPKHQDWLAEDFRNSHDLPHLHDALLWVHGLHGFDQHNIDRAKERLAFDEILSHILGMRILKNTARTKQSITSALAASGRVEQAISQLPFTLTEAQQKTLLEIQDDLNSRYLMLRLVQGDVGSGKTIVAYLASLMVLEREHSQVAFIVPTEVLAHQHYEKLQPLSRNLGVRQEVLTSSLTLAQKKSLKERLANGEIDLLIATHAAMEENVTFKKLALVIFDEQHKFGVLARNKMLQKGVDVHFLMMSATPIPRTLSMISYVDMDISIIDQKPANRKEIKTIALPLSRVDELIERVGTVIARNEKVFWLCPLIQENKKLDLTDVNARHEILQKHYPKNVGMIHGGMRHKDKEESMEKLINGEIKILIATTVIEVGVDVKDATLIVIEHAERFGLAQLHQLRGRVGRSDLLSSCVLLYGEALGYIGRQRLEVMRQTNDGFVIANRDLELRGQGDIAGLKQSGLPDFRVFNFLNNQSTTVLAHQYLAKIEKEAQSLPSIHSRIITPKNVTTLLQL